MEGGSLFAFWRKGSRKVSSASSLKQVRGVGSETSALLARQAIFDNKRMLYLGGLRNSTHDCAFVFYQGGL